MRGTRQVPEPEHGLHRPLHLGLARGAVAGHGTLDLGGRERHHRDAQLPGREVDHAAGVPHEHRGARELVLGVEILDHEELEFPFENTTLFKGLEEMGELVVEPRALREAYLEEMQKHTQTIRDEVPVTVR